MSTRPDYARVRRFLARGGCLQRDTYANGATYWLTAHRDGRGFATDTCEWLASLACFTVDGQSYHLAEPRPGIFLAAEGMAPEE